MLDKYFSSFGSASIAQIKKYKSLVETVKNFSFTLTSAKKKPMMTLEEQEFFKTYKETNNEVVAINVIVFLVRSGCIQALPNAGSVAVNHIESEI